MTVQTTLVTQERSFVRHNFTVNVLDGAFFGLALGVASYVTVIPLFVSRLTDSAILIGLIASLHSIGWQFPQLLTSGYVARLTRYKRMVMWMTLHERWPYAALALIALGEASLGRDVSLVLAFILITWMAFGGGFTATAWQSMIAKLMPSSWRGRFYGAQSAAANLMSSGGALLAGVILTAFDSPLDFALCFGLAAVSMLISGSFLGMTREWHTQSRAEAPRQTPREFVSKLLSILRHDVNYRAFLVARSLAQFAALVLAFYTVYAVRHYGMDDATAGVMTGVFLLAQTLGNPLLGWLGDRRGHRLSFALGTIALVVSAALAITAPSLGWFYIVFALAGIAQGALWTTPLALTADFGDETSRPYYIGLANTLVAPATLFGPIVGGWIAERAGFEAAFALAAIIGMAAAVVIALAMRDPRRRSSAARVTTDH